MRQRSESLSDSTGMISIRDKSETFLPSGRFSYGKKPWNDHMVIPVSKDQKFRRFYMDLPDLEGLKENRVC